MSSVDVRPHVGFLRSRHMTTCKRLYGRSGDFLRLVDDDEARDLLLAGKAIVRRGNRRGKSHDRTTELQLADAGPPMRGFPCMLNRAISRVCPEDWPMGYWEHNARARRWGDAV